MKISEHQHAILSLLALGIKNGANFSEALECLIEAYTMGFEDGSRKAQRNQEIIDSLLEQNHGR